MDGYNVIAASNFPDLNIPDKIGRHSPDVIAKDLEGTFTLVKQRFMKILIQKKLRNSFMIFSLIQIMKGKNLTYILLSKKSMKNI